MRELRIALIWLIIGASFVPGPVFSQESDDFEDSHGSDAIIPQVIAVPSLPPRTRRVFPSPTPTASSLPVVVTELKITSVRFDTQEEGTVLVITGIGPPLSELLLYIRPAQIILTVHADESGRFRAETDQELPDDRYVVYLEQRGGDEEFRRGDPFYFVKSGQSIIADGVPVPARVFTTRNSFVVLSLLGLAVILVGSALTMVIMASVALFARPKRAALNKL